jgi:hypothetical protein
VENLKKALAGKLDEFGLGDGGEGPTEEHLAYCGEEMARVITRYMRAMGLSENTIKKVTEEIEL